MKIEANENAATMVIVIALAFVAIQCSRCDVQKNSNDNELIKSRVVAGLCQAPGYNRWEKCK